MTLIDTYSQGDYTSRVYDNNMVEIEYNGTIIDNPGPWGDYDGAQAWAEAIVAKYAVDGHPS